MSRDLSKMADEPPPFDDVETQSDEQALLPPEDDAEIQIGGDNPVNEEKPTAEGDYTMRILQYD